MGFIKNSVVVVIGTLAIQGAALAAEWKCSNIAYVEAPSYTGTIYSIPLQSTCTVTHPNKQGFKSLHAFFLTRLTKLGKLKSNGSNETLQGLPGKVWLVEDNFKQNGNDLIVQDETHIASDEKTRLISSTYSQSVKGSGNSQYVSYLDSIVDVTSQDGQTYKVLFQGTIKLDKPWIVPEASFNGDAEKGATDGFATTRNDLIQQIAGAI